MFHYKLEYNECLYFLTCWCHGHRQDLLYLCLYVQTVEIKRRFLSKGESGVQWKGGFS